MADPVRDTPESARAMAREMDAGKGVWWGCADAAAMLRRYAGLLEAAPSPAVEEDDTARFDRADWYWRTMDPDDNGDSPHEAMSPYVPPMCVSEIASSYQGPTRYCFIAPVLDIDSDDTEVLHFATEAEALKALGERADALARLSAEEAPDHG